MVRDRGPVEPGATFLAPRPVAAGPHYIMTRYRVISIVARALLQGLHLRAGYTSATMGNIVDCRGELRIHTRADAFETGAAFVFLVGDLAAIRSCIRSGFRRQPPRRSARTARLRGKKCENH